MKTLTKKHAGLLNMTGSMASVLAALFSFAISPLLQQQIRIRAEQVQGQGLTKKRNGVLRWVKRSSPSWRGGEGKKRSEDMNPVAGESLGLHLRRPTAKTTLGCKVEIHSGSAVPPLHSLIQMSSTKGGHQGIVLIYPLIW